jgi:GDP-L-fucose synthase
VTFLSGKRILVTGGAGFLGDPVVHALVDLGADPGKIAVPRSRDFDLRSREECARAVAGVDLVIHLAGNAGGIGWNRSHPGALFYDNAAMGIHLMEESRRAGVSKFLFTGTVCSYPCVPPNLPFREEDLWEGYPEPTNAPYGIAKKALMVMAAAYREEYGFNAVCVMPVNLYGPRDHFFDPAKSHVIPALIQKFTEARDAGDPSVTIWGSGYKDGVPVSREFLYVGDAARGIALAAERYDSSEPVNLGSGEEVPLVDLVILVREMTGYRGEIVRDLSKPDGQPRRCLDTSRAAERFGFRAEVPFREGLRRTIEWYEAELHRRQGEGGR